jgi:3D (Asp-Asp-Asp) domain-containing protein
MNGRIANLTRLPHRLFGHRHVRGWILVACCGMSLTLLGAVRARIASPSAAAVTTEDVVPVGALEQSTDDAMLAQFTERARADLFVAAPAVSPASGPELLIPVRTSLASPGIVLPKPAIAAPKLRQMVMEVTAYCACKRCCGPRAQGITASGKRVNFNGGRFVAADPKVLKFNTRLLIPGYADGQPVQVIDKGGAIKGNKLDVFFDSHQRARQWGRQKLVVTVIED